jgi:cell division protein FtsW
MSAMNRKEKDEILEQSGRVDFNIWIVTILLCCFGAMMVFSVTADECSLSKACNYDSLYQVKRQAIFILAGFFCMFAGQFVSYKLLQKVVYLIYFGGILCTFLLKTPLAVSSHGATRWVKIYGPIQFQVAEVVKLCVIVFLAYMVKRYYKSLGTVQLTIYLWIAGGVPAVLLLILSNDLSSSVVVLGITFVVSFVCTKTWKLHVGVAALMFLVVGLYVAKIAMDLPSPSEIENLPFRVRRIAAWIDPERYASGQGYQVLQALYAIGRGGLFGTGLGNSIQKSILPEADNDMIFSILCEEMGAVGAALAIGLLAYLLYQILRVSISAENIYGSALALGVFAHIGLQSIINIAVNCSVFPNTGLTLPFFSSGGSSIAFLLVEVAMVLSVERERVVKLVRNGLREKQ